MDYVGSGRQVAPAAAVVVAQVVAAAGPPAVLPAGRYDIKVTSSVQGSAAADVANLKLTKTGTGAGDIANPVPAGVNAQEQDFTVHDVVLDGTTNLQVVALGAATAGVVYEATITATRTADRPGGVASPPAP